MACRRARRTSKGTSAGSTSAPGKRLWIFHTIPQPGEFGNDTWLKDSWAYTGNTGAWGQISIDAELQIAYLPVESATGDYFGADRPGNNLFAESLVAVDLQTGKRKWHASSSTTASGITTSRARRSSWTSGGTGEIIKAVAQPSKQAFMYVFDRVTGQPLWPIEERPVPKGDVPGEYYSPTQPFPLNGRGEPFKYDSQGFVVDDLIDFTPELRAEGRQGDLAIQIRTDFYAAGRQQSRGTARHADARIGRRRNELARRFLRSRDEHSVCELAEVGQPARPGAAARSIEERSRLRDGQRIDRCADDRWRRIRSGRGAELWLRVHLRRLLRLRPPAKVVAVEPALSVQGLPIMKPPYGQLSAIDLGKGEVIWQVPHGETPDAVRNHPALKGLNIPRTGRPGVVGSLTTKTLVISGEAGFGPTPTGARGAMLRAYDKATGKEVGAVYLPAPQTGSPMTYMLNGRQYLVVAVSGAGYSGELIAFRLPSYSEVPPNASGGCSAVDGGTTPCMRRYVVIVP